MMYGLAITEATNIRKNHYITRRQNQSFGTLAWFPAIFMMVDEQDEFAFYDIPDSIDYVLHATTAKSLSYIGFSQGTAQAFAALSIYPQLNEKVNVFIALAPAMSPKGRYFIDDAHPRPVEPNC